MIILHRNIFIILLSSEIVDQWGSDRTILPPPYPRANTTALSQNIFYRLLVSIINKHVSLCGSLLSSSYQLPFYENL